MRQSIFDYVGNLDTLIAVVIGAFLATSGALLAEIIQERTNRKRRERDAARFFGEILSSVDAILSFAFQSMSIGERWGGVSQRLFRTALREVAVYERNRERLFDIHDMKLRSRIHLHILSETVPMEAVLELCEQIAEVEKTLKQDSDLSAEQMAELKKEIDTLGVAREGALQTVLDEHAKTCEICDELEKIAKVKFDMGLTTNPANDAGVPQE